MITVISDDEQDSMELEGFVADTCVSCDGGDGEGMQLVACSGIGCPLAKHEECMTETDDKDRWFCRYCASKRALLTAERLRRKALRAKDKEAAPAFNVSRKVSVLVTDDDGVVRNGGEIEGVGGETENQTVAIANRSEKEISSSSSECRRASKSDQNAKCAASSSKSSGIPELNRSKRGTTSCLDLNKAPGLDRNEIATNSLSSELREVPELRRKEKATEVLAKSREVPEKTTSTKPRRVPNFSEELLYRISKRRRVNWTADELKFLMEGVLYYSPKVNQNVPWRKILGLGRHIFHNTRTPADLKDKWKVLCREVLRKRTQASL